MRAQHNATLQLGLEKVLLAVGGVASSENTRDHHEHMLITKSGELKSNMNELFSLLDSEDDDDAGRAYTREMAQENVEEIVSKSKELASQLRKEVTYSYKQFNFCAPSSPSQSNVFIPTLAVPCCDGSCV